MYKKFYVQQKYSRYIRGKRHKLIGGQGMFIEIDERAKQWKRSRSVMQKIVDRIHNDVEVFVRPQTKPKMYDRYFLSLGGNNNRFTRD